MEDNIILDESIPCEYCQEEIPLTSYREHLEVFHCDLAIDYMNEADDIMEEDNDIVEDEDEEEEDEDEDEDDEENFYDLSKYVNSNSQLTRGINIRYFLEEHCNIVSRRSSPTNGSILMNRIQQEQSPPRTNFYEFYSEFNDVEIGIDNIDKVSICVCLDDENKNDICPICQEMFIDNLKGFYRKLRCNHLYCADCIGIWLTKSKKCPVCKTCLEE